MNGIKIGQAVQYHNGMGDVFAAQVTAVWSDESVNLIFYDPNGATWRERPCVSRLMWVGNKTGHSSGFATLDQDGIAK